MVHSKEWRDNWKKPDLTPPPGKNLVVTEWGWVVHYPENLVLGNYVDIGYGAYINARVLVFIEDDVEIGGGCHIYSHDSIGDKFGNVILKEGCRIGAHSVILPGVTVGEGAVVGALSLVREDIGPGEVWAGVPARKIEVLSRSKLAI